MSTICMSFFAKSLSIFFQSSHFSYILLLPILKLNLDLCKTRALLCIFCFFQQWLETSLTFFNLSNICASPKASRHCKPCTFVLSFCSFVCFGDNCRVYLANLVHVVWLILKGVLNLVYGSELIAALKRISAFVCFLVSSRVVPWFHFLF